MGNTDKEPEDEHEEYWDQWPYNLDPDDRVAAGVRVLSPPAAASSGTPAMTLPEAAAEPDHQQQLNQFQRERTARQ